MITVITKGFSDIPLCKKEILRYAGCREADEGVTALLCESLEEALPRMSYKVCYCVLPVKIRDAVCDFDIFSVKSEKLAKNLEGCASVIVFAATVGIEVDRLITKYGRLSPSRALMMQAIGAERIEALCDSFCAEFEQECRVKLKPRFSAGYGDCPLSIQEDIFSLLNCQKRIGLYLNDSLLMSPTKSVTAFVGIKEKK